MHPVGDTGCGNCRPLAANVSVLSVREQLHASELFELHDLLVPARNISTSLQRMATDCDGVHLRTCHWHSVAQLPCIAQVLAE